jgi:DeoR/GlpR family transcriptional regulator of sugar metabolism
MKTRENNLEERTRGILEYLRSAQREWKVEELAARLGVSAITIRRDLEAMAQQGQVLRTHGGCLYAGRMAQEAIYHRRVSENFDLKRAIGRRAAASVKDGETILVDDGSTCFHVAAQLNGIQNLTLYTNSMPVVGAVAGQPGIRIMLVGGEYDAGFQHLGGALTEVALERISVDCVFVGTDAIDAEGRCLVRNEELARTAEVMRRCGQKRVLLADPTKCHASCGRVTWARLDDFDEWICAPGLTGNQLKKYGKQVHIKVAEL